jgi:opacity protein-like surface antigen
MKRTVRSLAIAAVFALLVPAVASAQNVYTAVRGGPGWTPATSDGRPGFEDPSEHKTGLTGSGAVGYVWPSGLRLEGEFGFLYAPVKSDAGVPTGGSIKSYLPMVNLFYDARPSFLGPLKACVGFGLGGARLNYNDEFISSTGVKMQADEWRTGFAYQVRAGIGYDINHRLALSAGYRYLHINRGHIEQGQGVDQHRVNFDVVQNHSIELGLAVKF